MAFLRACQKISSQDPTRTEADHLSRSSSLERTNLSAQTVAELEAGVAAEVATAPMLHKGDTEAAVVQATVKVVVADGEVGEDREADGEVSVAEVDVEDEATSTRQKMAHHHLHQLPLLQLPPAIGNLTSIARLIFPFFCSKSPRSSTSSLWPVDVGGTK